MSTGFWMYFEAWLWLANALVVLVNIIALLTGEATVWNAISFFMSLLVITFNTHWIRNWMRSGAGR